MNIIDKVRFIRLEDKILMKLGEHIEYHLALKPFDSISLREIKQFASLCEETFIDIVKSNSPEDQMANGVFFKDIISDVLGKHLG